MSEIQQAAVLGSGVMGASIAAHFANAGIPVLLFDIVPQGVEDRTALAKGAMEKLLKASPAPLTHPSKVKLITPCNLEDDLDKLEQVDWIVEAVLERLDVKQQVYHTLEPYRKKGSVIASNTSTLPLHALTEGMPESFRQDFMITHFFNPPRYMPLLELVGGKDTRPEALAAIRHCAEVKLGKGVVDCKDTPGFIANRIGCYWLMVGLLEALKIGITVEEADAVMGKPMGIPKTGVFGLFDLIGIDLMPLIAKSFLATLPADDDFRHIYEEPELITRMIADGYTGRKGKGGFYTLKKESDGKKTKLVVDLQTGEYRAEGKVNLASVDAGKEGLSALLSHPDVGGRYARIVMLKTLAYTASLIPEIAEDVASVDAAMRMGYNWKYGPFELIDRLATEGKTGASWLMEALQAEGMAVPAILTEGQGKPFYQVDGTKLYTLIRNGEYREEVVAEDSWLLADKKRGRKPLAKNGSAALWDVDDGVVCLELTSKMNALDPESFALMNEAIGVVQKGGYKGLMVGGDGAAFSAGANLGFFLYVANLAAWDELERVLKTGQDTLMALKYAPFPVVTAEAGLALGGGCELNLHADAIQAHIESYMGLVEVGVGVIPGWGGCKEALYRYAMAANPGATSQPVKGQEPHVLLQATSGPMPYVSQAFEQIMLAKVSASAEEAKRFGFLNAKSAISMSRKRLLADAKAKVLELAEGYQPPVPFALTLPGASGKAALQMAVDGFKAQGKVSPHDEVVADALTTVLTGGNADVTAPVTEAELLRLEREEFLKLAQTPATLARIEHMLKTGKPLRN